MRTRRFFQPPEFSGLQQDLGFVIRLLERIDRKLDRAEQERKRIMATLDDLVANVKAERTELDAMDALLNNIIAQLKANAADPAKIEELAGLIESNRQAIRDNVAANTPSASQA